MPAAPSSLTLRILSALVLAPPVVAAVYAGGVFFVALVCLAVGLMSWEWSRLVLGRFDWRGGGLVAGTVASVALISLGLTGSAAGVFVFCILWAGIVAGRDGSGCRLWLMIGAAYLTISGAAFLWLRGQPEIGLPIIAWLVSVVWATDIGAYAAGRLIGGPKLAPSISPKKTWAGLLGGIGAAACVGWISAWLAPMLNLSGGRLALASLGLAVIAQAGDLFVSVLKRQYGAKDASNLIPGHGGVLDRADSLLAAAIAVALFVAFRELEH